MKQRNRILFLLAPWLLCAQSARIVPNLAVAEAEYWDAEQSWLHDDPDLERDLYKQDRQVITRRIHRAAALRDDVMKKKEVYLSFLVKRVDDMKKRLSTADASELPLADLKRDLESEQSRILGEQDRLEERMRELPEGDEYTLVKRAMEAEHADLVLLQNGVAQQIRGVGDSDKAQQAGSGLASVEPLVKKLEDIGKIWEGERVRAVAARPNWAKYYAAMEKSLNEKNGPGPAPSAHPDRAPSAAPLPHPPAQPPHASNSVGATDTILSGSWAYRSQQGAWTGWGEPEMVSLQLRQTGPRVEGTYTARLPGRHDTRLLNLALEGQAEANGKARLRWTSLEPPAHGVMTVKASPDGRLLVERVNSEDNYIPDGMEVLQR
jgi:hypothetical protein